MSNFVGIDLGTTNSVICTYDGIEIRIWKSKYEQNDVTPSAIYFDRRGRKQIGQRAYDISPIYPNSCVMSFKRRMGEDTRIELSSANLTITPEECSVEILKELFSYLPEEIRKSSEIGTVVTVPAAFNQKARNATRQAAEMAGIGKVELMQEPVAAVMSYMQKVSNTDGTFLVYDLGGGTFDVAIAQSTEGKVTLLAHGGIEMCGGRDFDRLILSKIVLPLLHEKYDLPDDSPKGETFRKLLGIASYAIERAKIELSSNEETTIEIPHRTDWELHFQDLNGDPIFEEIPLQRENVERLIDEKINDTINCARKTMEECGVNPHDLDRIVWVGGPTHYKPLRDKISSELNISGEISNLNPMTAVAEGASLFAESIDWSSGDYKMKPTRGIISHDELALSFNYTARTPSDSSKIIVQVRGQVPPGAEFQVDNLDTGSTSGRIPLKNAATLDVPLTNPGENTFKVVVYDAVGEPIVIKQDKIVITKTAAIVETIPAPHSIALEVLDKPGGRPILTYLVRKNDPLPDEGTIELKANENLTADSSNSLNFTLWEGEFEENINANEYIGDFKIMGSDLGSGVIPVGAELICNYEIKTSGEIRLAVEVPDIGGIFEEVYSSDEGKSDYTTNALEIIEDGITVRKSVEKIEEIVDDPKLDQAKRKLEAANSLDSNESDPEKVKEAEQLITQAKELVEEVRRKNRKEIRQFELDGELTFFDIYCRQHTKSAEESAFDNLVKTAQRSIDNNDNNFDDYLSQLRARIFEILWRQSWFVIENFKQMVSRPYSYIDKSRFEELTMRGKQLLGSDIIQRYEELPPEKKHQSAFIDDGTIEELRDIIREMMLIPRVGGGQLTARDIAVNVFKA